MRRNCPERKKSQDNFLTNDSVNISDGYDNVEMLTVCTIEMNLDWIMDFGCTFHMTPRKEYLFNLRTIDGGKVLIGNDQSCSVTGMGSIRFQLWDGTIRVIENVRLVPRLRRNLLSLGVFDSNGYSYRLEKGILKVMKGVYDCSERVTTAGSICIAKDGHHWTINSCKRS